MIQIRSAQLGPFLLFTTMAAIAAFWLSSFKIKHSYDMLDVTLESIYCIAMVIAYLNVRHLKVDLMSTGLALLSVGLFIDVLDEFTKEPDLWNTFVQGSIELSGAILFSYALYKSHHKLHSDLAESKNQSQVHKHMAMHDPLTGMPNRLLLKDRLESEIYQAKQNDLKIAVLYVDLNDFKLINDEYGHAFGDDLLKELTSRLSERLRNHDMLARIGGDEFVIVMTHIHSAQEVQLAIDKVHAILNEPFTIQTTSLAAKCTVGFSIFPDDGETVTELLNQADKAMYKEKRRLKN